MGANNEIIYESVFASLARNRVRYLVAGGIAMILHGWTRFTKDLDLMLDLDDRDNVGRFVKAMEELGFQPHVPVSLNSLADPAQRSRWQQEKGAIVLNLGHLSHPLERIDIFLSNPLDFKKAYEVKKMVQIRSIDIPVISLEDLIAMKEKAARPNDLEDVKKLRAILYRRQKE